MASGKMRAKVPMDTKEVTIPIEICEISDSENNLRHGYGRLRNFATM